MTTGTFVDTTGQNNDSTVKTKEFFDNYLKDRVSYPSNQVDAVIGFFENRGFDKTAAISVSSVLLQQAKVDQINVMELIDKLKNYDKVALDELIGAILNNNRDRRSILGFKDRSDKSKNVSARNIIF